MPRPGGGGGTPFPPGENPERYETIPHLHLGNLLTTSNPPREIVFRNRKDPRAAVHLSPGPLRSLRRAVRPALHRRRRPPARRATGPRTRCRPGGSGGGRRGRGPAGGVRRGWPRDAGKAGRGGGEGDTTPTSHAPLWNDHCECLALAGGGGARQGGPQDGENCHG